MDKELEKIKEKMLSLFDEYIEGKIPYSSYKEVNAFLEEQLLEVVFKMKKQKVKAQ